MSARSRATAPRPWRRSSGAAAAGASDHRLARAHAVRIRVREPGRGAGRGRARRRAHGDRVGGGGGRAAAWSSSAASPSSATTGCCTTARCWPTPAALRAVYRKAHLWDAESDFFAPGTAPPPVVDTEFGRIAMMICYDVEFPEWVRRPALAGADLLAVPTNWPADPVPPGERPNVVLNVQARGVRQPDVHRGRLPGGHRAGRQLGRRQPHRRAGRLPAGRPGRRRRTPSWWSPTVTWPGPGTRRPARATTPIADRRPALYG